MAAVALPLLDQSDPRDADARQIAGPRDIRAVRTLRISVTDRCNFRCVYCMPEDKLDWVPRERLLTFEEIVTVARAAQSLGIHSFKLTGGEPLVRADLPHLVAMLKSLPGSPELSMTTNGSLLRDYAPALHDAGLNRMTVSLDSLRPDRFATVTRGASLDQVWSGIRAAIDAGFAHPKINCVAMRGMNDDEFADFAALTLETNVSVRFIEYMPLGRTALGGEYEERFISEAEIRERIARRFGEMIPATKDTGDGPAIVWRIAGAKGRIGFISAMSKPFCATCNRLRLTAEGQLRSCLFDGGEVELRPILRNEPHFSQDESRGAATANTRGRQPLDQNAPVIQALEGRRKRSYPDFPKNNSNLLEGGHFCEDRQQVLRDAFVRCVAFKPEVHSYFGNRQMSQIGG